ncbi:MAG: hypothetical protein ACRBN8_31190 [Nannocystales bacterium]
MTPAFALVLALLSPGAAEDEAQRALDLYTLGDYAEASAAYAAAYEADPNPDYLYGWAQSERRAGNCTRAVTLYREYAALPVSDAAKDAAAKNALRCGEDLEQTEQPPPPAAVDPTPAPDSTLKRSERWRSDGLGLTLVTVGGAAGIATLVLAADSAQQRRLAEDADLEAQYARKVERSGKTRTGAVVCGVLATAAITAGVVRLILVSGVGKRENATAWTPGRGARF